LIQACNNLDGIQAVAILSSPAFLPFFIAHVGPTHTYEVIIELLFFLSQCIHERRMSYLCNRLYPHISFNRDRFLRSSWRYWNERLFIDSFSPIDVVIIFLSNTTKRIIYIYNCLHSRMFNIIHIHKGERERERERERKKDVLPCIILLPEQPFSFSYVNKLTMNIYFLSFPSDRLLSS
jgi:hypothetical protein